jgi:predicted DCC family thiol-disulfide oxidoreductase YuxK
MLLVFYDNFCPLCLNTRALLEKVDLFGGLHFIGIREQGVFDKYPNLNQEKSLQRMATDKNGDIVYGFESIYRIIKAMPHFWIAIPFLLILRWTKLGEWFYDEIALRRKIIPFSCDENCEIPHSSK